MSPTERQRDLGVLSEDDLDVLEDIEEQDYVYSTRSPENRERDHMGLRTKVFTKKSLTKTLIQA